MTDRQGRSFFLSDIDQTRHAVGLTILFWEELARQGHLLHIWEHATVKRARGKWERGLLSHYEFGAALLQAFRSTHGFQGMRQAAVQDMAREFAVVLAHEEHSLLFSRVLHEVAIELQYFTAAISGSQLEIVEPYAKLCGFEAWIGTITHVKDGVYTGEREKHGVFYYDQKRTVTQELIARFGCSRPGSMAIGDSENDLGMLEVAHFPFAINPTLGLREIARKQRIPIVFENRNREILLLRSSHPDGRFEEVSIHDVLPDRLARRTKELSKGAIR